MYNNSMSRNRESVLRAVIEFLIVGGVSAMEIYWANRAGKFGNILSRITIRVYRDGLCLVVAAVLIQHMTMYCLSKSVGSRSSFEARSCIRLARTTANNLSNNSAINRATCRTGVTSSEAYCVVMIASTKTCLLPYSRVSYLAKRQ